MAKAELNIRVKIDVWLPGMLVEPLGPEADGFVGRVLWFHDDPEKVWVVWEDSPSKAHAILKSVLKRKDTDT